MTAQIYDFSAERVKRVKPAVKFHNPELLKLDVKPFEKMFGKPEQPDTFKEYGEHFK